MSASNVQTRNMAASTKQTEAQVGLNSVVRYLTKAVAAEGKNAKQRTVSSSVRKTPKRKSKQQKGKANKGNPKNPPEQTEVEVIREENNSESEVFSESDTGELEQVSDGVYNTLADLEGDINTDLDPRTISLGVESQPLLLLSLLKKIEVLESKQEMLEEENKELKNSLKFNMNKTIDLEAEMSKYKNAIINTQNKLENVNVANSKLKEKSVKAEAYSRRNNLRFEGIKSEPNETTDMCRFKIYSILVQELDIRDAESRIVIERCHRDQRHPNHSPASILVRFLSYLDRDEVWQKRDLLNKNQGNRIFMNQDFPPEVEKKRAFLRPYVKAAYAVNRKAVLVGDMIMVDGKKYATTEVEKLPEDMGPNKVAIQEKNDTLLFYRSDAYLSNFYNAPMTIENIEYQCVEQFFTAEKARTFGDHGTVNRIMDSNSPSEMKFLGRNTKGFSQTTWDAKASTVMLAGLRYKFHQNPILQKKLLDTQEKHLAEASKNDKVWGIGMSMFDPNAFDREKWQGKNQLGNLLMKVRDEIGRNNY